MVFYYVSTKMYYLFIILIIPMHCTKILIGVRHRALCRAWVRIPKGIWLGSLLILPLEKQNVRLSASLFYIERDPRSRMEKGERDTQVVRVNEATFAWPEATACHKPRRLSGVYQDILPPPPIVHSHRQKSVIFRKSD
jgi:hypothetical protein